VVFGKGNLGFFIAFVLIGGILGTALGSLFASLVPALAVLKTNLVPNAAVDLVVMSVSFNINPLTIAGIKALISRLRPQLSRRKAFKSDSFRLKHI